MSIFNLTIFKNINTNFIGNLFETCGDPLIDNISNHLNDDEQQLFINLFGLCNSYHITEDYVIDFDEVWKLLGFTQKNSAKQILTTNFELNKDYKIQNNSNDGKVNIRRGGHNKQIIMLNIETFKLFCINANMPISKLFQKYYVTFEYITGVIIRNKLGNKMNDLNKVNKIKTEECKSSINNTNIKNKIDKCEPNDNDKNINSTKGIKILNKLNELEKKVDNQRSNNNTTNTKISNELENKINNSKVNNITTNINDVTNIEILNKLNELENKFKQLEKKSSSTKLEKLKIKESNKSNDSNVSNNSNKSDKSDKSNKSEKLREKRDGYVAKLNKDKTKIENVYLNRKYACEDNGYALSSLDKPIKNNTETREKFYCMYEDCSKKLIKDFEKINGGKVCLYTNDGIGKFTKDNKLIKTYSCRQRCKEELGVGSRTINKIVDDGLLCEDYYYKNIQAKTQCIITNKSKDNCN